MKKRKKLQIHRETLHQLVPPSLRQAAGGETTALCFEGSHCACESQGCIRDSWQHTCGGLCASTMAHC